MWQSQAFGGALSFGGSVPDDQGAGCCVCPWEAPNPPAAMTVAPIALSKARRAMLSLISFPPRLRCKPPTGSR
jgi:hypothetical protein